MGKSMFYEPELPYRNVISEGHSFFHLLKLHYSLYISFCVELPICFLPSEFLRYKLLNAMLLGTQGSLDASCLALAYGWGINLSGGYHHASRTKGQGFCIYADITLIVIFLRKWFPNKVKRVMIVDLDAHQGNGYERDLTGDSNVFILDVYNNRIYPGDEIAKEGISKEVYVSYNDSDNAYLNKVSKALTQSMESFKPDFVIYNAGTDCMVNDPLGNLNVSAEGIISRDELMFRKCLEAKIPIVMLMSGGYQKNNGPTIGASIENLFAKFQLGNSIYQPITD